MVDLKLASSGLTQRRCLRDTATALRSSHVRVLAQVATLVFVAEWGDRSMLATIVLAASQSPAGAPLPPGTATSAALC